MENMTEAPDVEGDPSFIEATAAAPQVVRVPPPRPKAPAAPKMNAIERADEIAMLDWISSLAGDAEIKINILRKKPVVGPNGENVGGSLETVSQRIDEDYIRDMWGGGTFRIAIQAMTPQGDYKYVKGGTRQIDIAGAPKMAGAALTHGSSAPMVASGEDSMAERAFNEVTRIARDERARADSFMKDRQTNSGVDFAAIQALNAPMFDQLAQAQRTISELQQQMIAISSKPPARDEFRDRLMERALDGESSRLETLRAQYENRIEKLRDSFDDQVKRAEDRHAGDIKRLEDRHERELRNAEKTSEHMTKNTDVAYQARLDSLKDDKVRLQADLAAAATRIAALEARKDQTMGEKVEEISKMKDLFEGFGSEAEEESTLQKIISTVGNLPVLNNAIEKLTGAAPPPGQPQLQQPQLPPPGVPFQTGDGNVYVQDAAGNVSIVDQGALRQQRQLEKARRRKRAAQAGAPAETGVDPIEDGLAGTDVPEAPPIGPAPSASDVKMAINFMENALRGGATPESFGATARNLLPSDTLTFVQAIGPEEFLNKWAKLESGSPLASIRGREWVRKVFKFLVGDTSE